MLTERHVRPVEAVGGQFDPNIMRVLSTECDATRVVGEVLSEARRGYTRDDELLRLAEVIVNKREDKA